MVWNSRNVLHFDVLVPLGRPADIQCTLFVKGSAGWNLCSRFRSCSQPWALLMFEAPCSALTFLLTVKAGWAAGYAFMPGFLLCLPCEFLLLMLGEVLWPIFGTGHVELYFETVNLSNNHAWLEWGLQKKKNQLLFSRLLVSIHSGPNWIIWQELWRAALAGRQLYGKVPAIQAIYLSCYQLHPWTGLGPGVEGTDRSLWSSNEQP